MLLLSFSIIDFVSPDTAAAPVSKVCIDAFSSLSNCLFWDANAAIPTTLGPLKSPFEVLAALIFLVLLPFSTFWILYFSGSSFDLLVFDFDSTLDLFALSFFCFSSNYFFGRHF